MIQIKHVLAFTLLLNVFIIGVVYKASHPSHRPHSHHPEDNTKRHGMRPETLEEAQRYIYEEAKDAQYFKNEFEDKSQVLTDEMDFSTGYINEMSQQFANPFELLGAYPPIEKKYFNTYPDKKMMYNSTDHGLFNDEDYCQVVDGYNLENPENMFQQMNFFTDYADKEAMTRQLVIKVIGNDTMPKISTIMKTKDFYSRKYHLAPQITNYFTKRVDLHLYHEIGKHFLCATQMYNHIPGHGVVKRKDLIVGTIERYAERFKTRPQCFNKDKFFPLTYRLYQKAECVKFFKILNSKKYKDSLKDEPIQFLLKVGVGAHKAAGVSLVDQAKTNFLMKKYKNGTLCEKNIESYVAQTYIANPLLLDRDNKFDFRIYMLVASTNPLIVYYHDGIIRVSLTPYDKSSDDRGTHLTNTALSLQKFTATLKNLINHNRSAEVEGMTKEEAKKYMLWKFEDLETYLVESGKVKDPEWLDNYLRPAFRKAFIHVSRLASDSFWKQSNVYELFGLDFMLDDNMNLWLIECNSSPQLPESNGREFMVKMMTDVFEIQYAYYRSRMKRVLDVITRMQEEQSQMEAIDIQKWKDEYQEASKNRLEPEYSISNDSSFTLILDENLPGDAAYLGNLPPGCA